MPAAGAGKKGGAKKASVPPEESTPATTPVPAKKAKKNVKVVAYVGPNGIEGSFTPEPRRPLIAHLHVDSSLIFSQSDSTEPAPYNADESNDLLDHVGASLNSASENHGEERQTVNAAPALVPEESTLSKNRPIACFEKISLMVQFEEASKAKKLPPTTDIACFWCAHTFENQPCIIPEREIGGTFIVYGNFCCPECALAYLLHETIDPHVRWERIALLHRIYDREGRGRMFPAPARELLRLFGGTLSIDSYRATIRQGKVRVDLHMPPMVSILGSIDTKPIDFFDSSIKNTIVGALQLEKATKAEEGLRLKRNKPLKDRESTLDSVMSISIKASGR